MRIFFPVQSLALLIVLVSTGTGFLLSSQHSGENRHSSTLAAASSNNQGDGVSFAAIVKDVNAPRAGKDGYSLMRQPLLKESWDPNTVKTFDAPSTIEEQDTQLINMEWWSGKQQQNSQKKSSLGSKSSSRKVEEEDDDEDSDSSLENGLNLFQRSMDTLDFPFVLKALRQECFTTPAKTMVQEALQYSAAEDADNKSKKKKTPSGRAYQPLVALTVEDVQERYEAVKEMQWLLEDLDIPKALDGAYYKNRRGYQVTLGNGNPPPLDGLSFDLDSILEVAANGQILEGPELLEISTMMNAMEDLQLWNLGLLRIDDDDDTDDGIRFKALPKLAAEMQLNSTLQELLEEAFDTDGKLSGTTFPFLGQLRAKIKTLRADILQTLDTLVSMPSIQSKLALESGGPLYSEISNGGGRLVLPMDPKYATQIGIVHDSSRSGKTVYVEPSEVVGPTNELRQTEGELKAEEARVWRLLTEQVWINRRDLERSVRAVGQLDLVLARCLMGRKLQGVIPQVQDEGVISLRDAKHPVLLLRKVSNTVGSDIDLGADGNAGLVLTGPNSGGKTVILKLLGLVALMARSGIPVPAQAGQAGYQPRVDFFDPVLADIGDIQSVGGDLSTFSGHMLVCREVLVCIVFRCMVVMDVENCVLWCPHFFNLYAALSIISTHCIKANSGRNALVLMDELGSGTDPAQGVAIAQALLEALMEKGCRVAITTHYMALKQLAASDDRFSVAGMQFVGGRPTYKLLPGTVGESFALAVAERLELPASVLERANELLDSETRQMGDLIRDLEDQKTVVEEQVAEMERRKQEMAEMEIQMKEERNKLEKKLLTARRDEARRFAKKLEEKEQVLENVLEKLKSDPSRKILAKSWDDIKFVKRDALNEAENIPSVLWAKQKAAMAADNVRAELVPLAELRDKPELKDGDTLIVCKPGSLFGREATIIKNMGRQMQVLVSGIPLTLKLTELSAVMDSGIVATKPRVSPAQSKKQRLSKAAEKALQQDGGSSGRSIQGTTSGESKPSTSTVAIRTDSNTVDIRGNNFEEGKSMIKEKISRCLMNGQSVIYVLHGHGTGGVLKSKVRGWLKTERQLVKRFSPADQGDGGDAFTKIEVR
jgi:DNA mismatch repair protein MutS2